MFLTRPVVDVSLDVTSFLLGKLAGFGVGVPVTMVQCVIPGLDVEADLPMPSDIHALSIYPVLCVNYEDRVGRG